MKRLLSSNNTFLCLAPFLLVIFLGFVFSACESPQPESVQHVSNDITDLIDADTTLSSLAQHLLEARNSAKTTRALSRYFPDLNRQSAYRIQLATMELEEQSGEMRFGWKMGGTRVTDPEAQPDPSYGYSLSSHFFMEGESVPARLFVGDSILVEAEIVVYINRDLPGPSVTREALVAAIDSVGGALEFISTHLLPADDDHPESLNINHLIADNLSHAGAILGKTKTTLTGIDLGNETARAVINGEEKASGSSADIFGGDPLGAVLWLANELPKRSLHLSAGDFVITGSMYDNPTLYAGERAHVTFDNLGHIAVELMPADR